jgi:hypothetical protein
LYARGIGPKTQRWNEISDKTTFHLENEAYLDEHLYEFVGWAYGGFKSTTSSSRLFKERTSDVERSLIGFQSD